MQWKVGTITKRKNRKNTNYYQWSPKNNPFPPTRNPNHHSPQRNRVPLDRRYHQEEKNHAGPQTDQHEEKPTSQENDTARKQHLDGKNQWNSRGIQGKRSNSKVFKKEMKNATNKQITEMTRKRTQEDAENKTKTKHWWENYWFWDWLTLIFSFIFNFRPVFFCQILHLLFICVGLYVFSETIASECSTGHCTYRAFYMHMDRVPPWTVKQSSYPRPVLAFGYCHRPCLCICQCVCVSVCVSITCLSAR